MFGHDQFNWTKIQNFKAEGDYSWKQTGNKNSKVTAEDPDCYTIFKSNAEVIGPDGEPIKVSETGQSDAGIIPCWADIPEGSKIKWMAKTLADDKQPAPDRVQVTLTWMDSVFAAKVVNEVIEELSEVRTRYALNKPNRNDKNYHRKNDGKTYPSNRCIDEDDILNRCGN